MDRIRTANKLNIHVENDQLVMYGAPNESAGCVLRGVLDVVIAEPTKVKSISLLFIGKMMITWTEPIGNGHERLFRDERTITSHKWSFLERGEKLHHLNPGNYTYGFELALAGNLPESTHIAAFYVVQYRLKAVVERSRFVPNQVARHTVHLTRQMLPLSYEFLEPVQVASQWINKLDYEITLPTKVYTHTDRISATLRVSPLVDQIRIRHVTCVLKEYMVCRARSGWFGGSPRTHTKVIYFKRDDQFGLHNTSDDERFIVWLKTITIQVPSTPDKIQYDVDNEAVRIRHKLKFVLSIENSDGHVSELRAALPIRIYAVNTTGLPSYEDTWRSIPYNPLDMLALMNSANDSSARVEPVRVEPDLPSYNTLLCGMAASSSSAVPSHLPTYDEVACLSH